MNRIGPINRYFDRHWHVFDDLNRVGLWYWDFHWYANVFNDLNWVWGLKEVSNDHSDVSKALQFKTYGYFDRDGNWFFDWIRFWHQNFHWIWAIDLIDGGKG